MKAVASFIGFAAAFLIGMVLVITGAAGSQWVDCPATMVQFPASEMTCNLFSGLVYGGGLMALVGAGGLSWIGMFGKLPD